MEFCLRKTLEFCKRSLMDHINGNLAEQKAQRTVSHRVLGSRRASPFTQNEDSVRNFARWHSLFILVSNLAVSCLCPGNLREVEFKGNRLICLVEEISRQDNIQPVVFTDHCFSSGLQQERTTKTGKRYESCVIGWEKGGHEKHKASTYL